MEGQHANSLSPIARNPGEVKHDTDDLMPSLNTHSAADRYVPGNRCLGASMTTRQDILRVETSTLLSLMRRALSAPFTGMCLFENVIVRMPRESAPACRRSQTDSARITVSHTCIRTKERFSGRPVHFSLFSKLLQNCFFVQSDIQTRRDNRVQAFLVR